MNPDMQKELLARLDALAAKLGIGAQALWALYLRQAKIEAITDFIIAAFLIALAFACYRVAVWANSLRNAELKKSNWTDRSDGPGIWLTVSVIGAIGSFLAGISVALYAFTPLLNPGFWAFQEIMGAITNH